MALTKTDLEKIEGMVRGLLTERDQAIRAGLEKLTSDLLDRIDSADEKAEKLDGAIGAICTHLGASIDFSPRVVLRGEESAESGFKGPVGFALPGAAT